MGNGRPRKRDHLDAQRIVLLRENGFSWGQVARSLGVARDTIGLRRREDVVFRNLTDIKRGKPSAEYEAAMIVLAESDVKVPTQRAGRCRGCFGEIAEGDETGRCQRCHTIQAAIEQCEASCAALFTKQVSENRARRQALIAALPNETRKLVRKIETMHRKGNAFDLAARLRQAADALEMGAN